MGLILLFGLSCSQLIEPRNPGLPFPNKPPETTLANVPPENTPDSPYNYRIKLYWDGGDDDGYIVGYKYRINNSDWVFTQNAFATLDFPSPDSLNEHLFQVKAVDDAGDEDPTPAQRRFYTRQTVLPKTQLVSGPPENKPVFILKQPTEMWTGIEFVLTGKDDDGQVVAYEYRLDETGPWLRSSSPAIRIYGDLADGRHLFGARAIDNASGVDPTPLSVAFHTVQPVFSGKILVVDETRDGVGTDSSPSDQMVDDFYRAILADFDKVEYDLKLEGGLTAANLAGYDLIVWHADDRSENLMKNYIDDIKSYLTIGGKLFLSGWRVLETVDNVLSENHIFSRTDFSYQFLKLHSYRFSRERDFIGAVGSNGYPDLTTDPKKMPASYQGILNFCAALIPFDPANQILLYRSHEGRSSLEGLPCAVKFRNSTYAVIALGFPLYVIDQTQARQFIKQAIFELRQ